MKDRLKIEINDRLSSNTVGITFVHFIFDILVINGNQCRKHFGKQHNEQSITFTIVKELWAFADFFSNGSFLKCFLSD